MSALHYKLKYNGAKFSDLFANRDRSDHGTLILYVLKMKIVSIVRKMKKKRKKE